MTGTQRIRLLLAAAIFIFPILLGWFFRSPFLIPILAVIYVSLYFLGKQQSWSALRSGTPTTLFLKAAPFSFAVQCTLVGFLYLAGAGLSTLFTNRTVNWSLELDDLVSLAGFAGLVLPLTIAVAYAENDQKASEVMETIAPSTSSGEGDFIVLPRTVTPTDFYSGWHFNRSNHARSALVDVVDHRGRKPVRAPKEASEAMISAAETRLGIRFPEALREIYKIQDGGSMPTYFVPKYEGASRTYDDWISAFAYDYDVLSPLADLRTLHDHHMDFFDPEHDDESEKDDWIPGSDKLVVLASRTGYGTALDFRNGDEPGVLLFDNNEKEPELKRYDNFDDFLAALHEIEFDYNLEDDDPEDQAFGTPPDPLNGDQFWKEGNAGAAVTDEDWSAAGKKLGFALPDGLLPFYKAANGGTSSYQVALADIPEEAPLHVFPTGPYVDEGLFLRLEHWASLATLSDRLDFIDDRTPWRELYDNPEKLIVISAAFDSAILLDYRKDSANPAVLTVSDLDDPSSSISFQSVGNFLGRLRQYGLPDFEEKNQIGDDSIGARGSNAETFWIEDERRKPVDVQVMQAFVEKWGLDVFGLPQAIEGIYEQQNGGLVRFRYAPPLVVNERGYALQDPAAEEWVNVFPNGLLPMEEWLPFEEWRSRQNLATGQSLFDFADRIDEPYSAEGADDTQIRLFVIGEHQTEASQIVTLLDLSSDFFNRNRHVLTLSYTNVRDEFDIIFGPNMVDNIYAGLHQTLKARKSELQ